jgi:hypothetical protein
VRAWSADAGDRDGPEFTDPARGEYHLQAIPLNARVLAAIDLKPDPLAELLLDHLRAGTDLFSFLTFAPEQRTALAELRFHWADAYRIDSHDGFVWTAVPLADPAVTIACNSSGELRMALRDHYADRAGRRTAGGCST